MFLWKQPQVNHPTALDALFKRRGDIGKIELTCHNTNTTLPYVDLVIEILEHFIANVSINSGQDWWDAADVPQTVGEAEDLRVHPEHIVQLAYEDLQNRVFPWTLPFNLWSTEVRAYLKPLAVNRVDMMRLFNSHAPDELPDAVQDDMAAEALGMTSAEWRIIIGQLAAGLDGWGGAPIGEISLVKTMMQKGSPHVLRVATITGYSIHQCE